jgi:hypothetical protein
VPLIVLGFHSLGGILEAKLTKKKRQICLLGKTPEENPFKIGFYFPDGP